MIQTDPKSKNNIVFFYFLGFVISLLFIVTVFGINDIINQKGEHPIIKLLNRLQYFDLQTIIIGFLGFVFVGYVVLGSFFLITFLTFLIFSKIDSNLKQITWSESNYLPQDVRNWMNVSFSTFVLTLLSTMVGFILMSFIYAFRY